MRNGLRLSLPPPSARQERGAHISHLRMFCPLYHSSRAYLSTRQSSSRFHTPPTTCHSPRHERAPCTLVSRAAAPFRLTSAQFPPSSRSTHAPQALSAVFGQATRLRTSIPQRSSTRSIRPIHAHALHTAPRTPIQPETLPTEFFVLYVLRA